MSVINTMLKDLERRGVECDRSDNNVLGGLSANKNTVSEARLSSNVYFISLLSAFSVLVIIGAIYTISPYKIAAITQENNAVPITRNSGILNTEMQPDDKPALVLQNKVTVDSAAVVQRVPTFVPISTSGNGSVVVASRVALPVVNTVSAVQKTNIQDNAAVKLVAKNEPQQVKPAAIKQAVKTTPVKKQKTVIAEEEDSDEIDNDSETSQVVSKKQRAYTPQEKSDQAYTTASSFYKQGNKQQAKASLKEAIAYSSENINQYSLLAVIYLEEKRANLASEVIENGLAKHHNDQTLLRLYLQSLVQEDKYKEAITVMEQRLRLTSPEDLGYLAGLYQKQNDHINAIKFYGRALQLKPSTSIWWMGQGISLEAIEKNNEALQSYQQSISTGQLSGKLAQYAISRIKSIKQITADSVS